MLVLRNSLLINLKTLFGIIIIKSKANLPNKQEVSWSQEQQSQNWDHSMQVVCHSGNYTALGRARDTLLSLPETCKPLN